MLNTISNERAQRFPGASLTVPELDQSKANVLATLPSAHSRRSYEYALSRFIDWYCSESRLGFNRSTVVRYRSFLESIGLAAATINLHLSAIRRLADESTESGWLSPELATGIRRVKGIRQLGRRIGNWLTCDQAQAVLDAIDRSTLKGKRDAAMLGVLLGCGLRRSEVAALSADQLQLWENHWVIANLTGKGGRVRTVPVPGWCKSLLDFWLSASEVHEGRIFRRLRKSGRRQESGITINVIWDVVRRCANDAGIGHLAPHD